MAQLMSSEALSERFMLEGDPMRKQAKARNHERIAKLLRPLYEKGRAHVPSAEFCAAFGLQRKEPHE